MLSSRHGRCWGWAVGAILLIASVCQAAETYEFRSQAKPGTTAHVDLLLEVGGDLKLTEKGNVRALPMSVVAKMQYDERLAELSADGATSMRLYSTAEATIKLDKGKALKPKLRTDRKAVAVRFAEKHATLVSPAGPLSRDELELIDIPGNTLLVERLLPVEPVAEGQTWTHSEAVMTALLGLDAISQNDVTSVLKEVDAHAARFEMSGTVLGAIDGISATLQLKGRYKFDRHEGRITWFAILIEEKRSIGHVAPGADVVARLQMTIAPTKGPAELAEADVSQLNEAFNPSNEVLEHATIDGRFRFFYDRRWHIMDETPEAVALRMVDRGDLVAQCNVSLLASVEPQRLPTLAQFQDDIRKSLDKHFTRFLKATEGTTADGYTVYRTVVEGTASDLPIVWNYYHVADAHGQHAVFAFTLEQDMSERFASVDQAMIGSAQFESNTAAARRAVRR
ncbi:MAG TPA: hypothetical protein VHV77_13445 [Pirellulales bacterium]|jgi:hypothetical protein|nr:hypothetical protein [Pirellulales bacterium]